MTTTSTFCLENGLTIAQRQLAEFAQSEEFQAKLALAFGASLETEAIAAVRQVLIDGSRLPHFEVRTSTDLQGALAAYAASSRTVFVSDSFLAAHAGNPEAIAAVLLEEIGHDLDARLNPEQDTAGDEGAIFSALVQNQTLSESQLQQLRTENDGAWIAIDGVATWVEMATTEVTGGSQSIDNRQPFGTLTYAIALQGIFPSRSLKADRALTTGERTPFLGEIIQFAGNFVPRGYALANGQILSIAQNTALFALLGTTYGGDGRVNFALPDLRGRAPIGAGSALGRPEIDLGQISGSETIALTQAQLPAHNHAVEGNPTDLTGSGQSFSTLQPTLGLTPVITTDGSFDDVGHIGWFAGNFAPQDHAIADGRLLPISSYLSLFSRIGTTYGGDGVNTFALPDLRGRVAVDDSATRPLGSVSGSETVTLTPANLPTHSHSIAGSTTPTSVTGSGTAFSNVQPSLALSYEIATQGTFPSRDLQAADPGNSEPVKAATGFVSSAGILSDEVAATFIRDLAQVGVALWKAAGISLEQVAQLESVTYQVADLESGYLAVFGEGNVITIDADASDRRWFVDSTPNDSEEFGSTDPITGEQLATDVSALDSYDLLTVILHEQGHRLGLGHTDTPGSIMFGALGTGGRFLPAASDLINATHDDVASPFFSVGDPLLGEVAVFASPRTGNSRNGFLPTDGQVLSIFSNQALFSLLGTAYGGDGQTTFALPDFRDRTVLHAGAGSGLSTLSVGDVGGSETTTLSLSQMPAHSHTFTPNKPPLAVNDSGFTAIQGITQTIPIASLLSNDSDPEGDSLQITSVNNASNGTVTLNDNGTATLFSDDFITFTSTPDFTGNATFEYTVSDGVANANATVTIAVSVNPNNNPTTPITPVTPTTPVTPVTPVSNIFNGTSGDDILTGGTLNDQLTGGLGADTLAGGAGGDRFIYSGRSQRQAFSNSLINAPDRITDFSVQQGDRIQLDYDNNLATSQRPRKLFNVGRIQAKTLVAAAKTAYGDKRSRKPGKQPLAANEAIFFRWGSRTYLSVNDRKPAFSGGRDLVIEMTGTALPGASGLQVDRYFV
jgi:microcystin-dependent protein